MVSQDADAAIALLRQHISATERTVAVALREMGAGDAVPQAAKASV